MAGLYLDHVLIAVRSLSQASQTFAERLGFTLTPEGVHPGRGTHNRLIVFGPDYLELIAIRDASEGVFRPTMAKFLASREGLYMFALGTSDISEAVSSVRSRGVPIQEPSSGARQGSGRSPGYTWTFAGIPPQATPGSETFIIQHHNTVEERYPEPPNATQHPNGATGIHHLAIAVRDSDAAASRWQQAFGFESLPAESIPGGVRRARLKLQNCYLDFVSPLRSGELSRFLERNGEAPYTLSLKVRDLSQTAAELRKRGVPVSRMTQGPDGSSVMVAAEHAQGVAIQLVQQDA
jgi:4-hydroxyphenylpyruvate dioxygenase-like putative hemolysin